MPLDEYIVQGKGKVDLYSA